MVFLKLNLSVGFFYASFISQGCFRALIREAEARPKSGFPKLAFLFRVCLALAT